MKAIFFHLMNSCRPIIMIISKIFVIIFALVTLFGWIMYLNGKEEVLEGAIASSVLFAIVYFFRWYYDVLLVRLNPVKEGIAVSQGDSFVYGAGKRDFKGEKTDGER